MTREFAWDRCHFEEQVEADAISSPELMGYPDPVTSKLEAHNCWMVRVPSIDTEGLP